MSGRSGGEQIPSSGVWVPRARRPGRRWRRQVWPALTLAALTLASCEPSLELPADARIECDGAVPCPDGFVCSAELGRCVSTSGDDAEAPGLVHSSVHIEPALARRDTPVLVQLRATEPLGVAPEVSLVSLDGSEAQLGAGQSSGVGGDTLYHFVYAPTGTEDELVRLPLLVALVDEAGNVARDLVLGEVAFDFESPTVVTAQPTSGETLRPGDTAQVLVEASEPLATAPVARVVSSGQLVACEPTWRERSYACTLTVPSSALPVPISLELRLRDLAGNEGVQRLDELLEVDSAPPSAPSGDAQGWLLLSRSPTGIEASGGQPFVELLLCPSELPWSGPSPGGDGDRDDAPGAWDDWSWCPDGERPPRVFEPGGALLALAAGWSAGALVCGAEVLAEAPLMGESELVLALDPARAADVCVAIEDRAGNRSAALPVERVELRLAAAQPMGDARSLLQVEARTRFGASLEAEAGAALAMDSAPLALRDGAVVTATATGLWRPRPFAEPSARYGHALTTDWARGRVVLFGGQDPQRLGDTWEWDGLAWQERQPAGAGGAPVARAHAALAFDASRNRAVLFGGEAAGGALGDTWEWDGQRWQSFPGSPAASPAPRRHHALAYAGPQLGVVLFGGQTSDGERLADLWRWDGGRWTEIVSPAGSAAPWPAPRSEHALAGDADSNTLLLYGGRVHDGLGEELADLWVHDGDAWHLQEADAAPTPGPRAGHALVWDPDRATLLMVGGTADDSYQRHTWSWSAGVWSSMPLAPPGLPEARSWHALAFDPLHRRPLLFGGAGPAPLGDTSEWDGAAWIALGTGERGAQQPQARSFAAAATLPALGHTILFGGHAWSGRAEVWLGDTWAWDGWRWRVAAVAGEGPSPRSGHAMTVASGGAEALLFGGYGELGNGGSARLDDLWRWDGAAWTSPTGDDPPGQVRPPARNWHALAWDNAREELVLFGGRSGTVRRDTWLWDGVGWREPRGAGATAPSARDAHAMAYDPVRGETVLFGGRDADQVARGDTWVWDGTLWRQQPDVGELPSPRVFPTLVWDEASERLLLFGGSEGSGAVYRDLWAWEGDRWQRLHDSAAATYGPPGRLAHVAAPDPDGRGALIFGGHAQQLDRRMADTWHWRPAVGERPAVVVRAALAELVGPAPAIFQGLGVQVRAGAATATGTLSPVRLHGWQQQAWLELVNSEEHPGAALAELRAASLDPEENLKWLTEDGSELVFAVTPAPPSDAAGASVSLDYLEVRVRVRRELVAHQ